MIGDSSEADSLFTKIEKAIKDANASNVASQKMGKKPLAYTIKKQKEADYFLFSFEAEGTAPEAIIAKLKLEQDAILRYMMLNVKESKRRNKKGKKGIEGIESTEGEKLEGKPSFAKASEGKKVAKVEVVTDTKKGKGTEGTKSMKGTKGKKK